MLLGFVLPALLATGFALAAYAFWVEPRRLVVTRVEVASSTWPAGAPALRIVVLADLHAAGPHVTPERIRAIVARANAERPDLVALLGDYVFEQRLRTSFVPPEAVAAALAGLRARLGVFAVIGNHDWVLGGLWVRRALEAPGLVVLDNEVRRVEADGFAFWVAGVGDRDVDRDDLPGTLRQVADGAPVLLLTHSPDLFPDVPDRVALTLAGHTHGGQCELPVVTRFVIPSRYGRRYAYGHIVEGGRHLVVSCGIGATLLPMRFRMPPEIVVVTLRAAAAGPDADRARPEACRAGPGRPRLRSSLSFRHHARPVMTVDWHGIFPAATTQFRDDHSLDLDATQRHIDAMIADGVHGMIAIGTVGENSSLDGGEKRELIAAAKEAVGGRVPLLAGVAECTTKAACDFARDAEASGLDGLMVLPAMIYKSNRRETLAHYRAVAHASGLPIMVYNNPVSYSVDITPEMFRELADEPTIVAIKESSENLRRITDIKNLTGDRYVMFCGVDDLFVEAFVLGAVGWVAGLVNAFPRETVALYDLMRAGRQDEALALYRWFMPLLHLDCRPTLVQCIKYVQAALGRGTENVRPPRLRLEGEERAEVQAIVEAALASRPDLSRLAAAA